jgi:hypothetical protein
MRAVLVPIALLFAGGCEVGDRGLCLDLTANKLDPGTGCVSLQAESVPAERCAPCPDQQCGIDLECKRSSCVVAPDGGVYLVFCLDARQRTWPAGWRPLSDAEVATSAALTDAQRASCRSSAPWTRICRTR